MKKYVMAALVMSGLAIARSAAFADEKTVTGDGKCAKCVLKEAAACQTVITAEEGGKKLTYYLTQNEVSKELGDRLCQKSQKVKATGTVKSVDGKLELTPTKIELVKD